MGNLSFCGAIMFLVPTSAIGITGACGNDAANRAIRFYAAAEMVFCPFRSSSFGKILVLNLRQEHLLLRQARRHHLPLDEFQFGR